jgi:hypothetical protein
MGYKVWNILVDGVKKTRMYIHYSTKLDVKSIMRGTMYIEYYAMCLPKDIMYFKKQLLLVYKIHSVRLLAVPYVFLAAISEENETDNYINDFTYLTVLKRRL